MFTLNRFPFLLTTILFLLSLLGTVFFPFPARCATHELVIETTPATHTPSPAKVATSPKRTLQEGQAPDEDVRTFYVNPVARVAFVFFIFVFIGAYFLIRRQPTAKQLKKKQKKKL